MSTINRDTDSTSGKDGRAGGLTLRHPRLALIWLAAVVLASLVPFVSWLVGHVSR